MRPARYTGSLITSDYTLMLRDGAESVPVADRYHYSAETVIMRGDRLYRALCHCGPEATLPRAYPREVPAWLTQGSEREGMVDWQAHGPWQYRARDTSNGAHYLVMTDEHERRMVSKRVTFEAVEQANVDVISMLFEEMAYTLGEDGVR